MSGTRAGGLKLAAGRPEGYYSRIGTIGGSRKVPKGFALDRERAVAAGKKGGTISRRPKESYKSSDTVIA